MSRIVIKAEGLSKYYRLGRVGTGTLAGDLKRFWAKTRGKPDPYAKLGQDDTFSVSEHWALKDISFDVKQGEALGIIGKNGAGKSTLLKILSRVTTPTSGTAKIKGRIASLLEVGTGFHPDLSGRENIFLNGAILGMSKAEIRSKFDEIVAFSGVDKYIDTPVKRYSSGMYVRLAFAVAAHLEPEILVVDEVLAVGDADFQKKCLGKMQDVSHKEGRTVLFVSHNMNAVRNLCSRAIVLSNGSLVFDGGANEAIAQYLSANTEREGLYSSAVFDEINEQAMVRKVELKEAKDSVLEYTSEKIRIDFSLQAKLNIPGMFLGIVIEDVNGNTIIVSSTDENEKDVLLNNRPGIIDLHVGFPGRLLKPGKYFVTFSLRTKSDKIFHRVERALSFEVVDNYTFRGMKNRYRPGAIVAPEIEYKLL